MAELPDLNTDEAIDAWARAYAHRPRGHNFAQDREVMRYLARCVRKAEGETTKQNERMRKAFEEWKMLSGSAQTRIYAILRNAIEGYM